MLLALHGQNKDALAKLNPGAWEYDIIMPGYKCNMTDINAAIGLAQLKRYNNEILIKKEQIIKWYEENLKNIRQLELPKFETENKKSSLHLYMIRLKGADSKKRNTIIQKLAEKGISTNVHFQPLPLLTAYKNIGLCIDNFPEAYKMYENQISLPFHNFINEEDTKYIAHTLEGIIRQWIK